MAVHAGRHTGGVKLMQCKAYPPHFRRTICQIVSMTIELSNDALRDCLLVNILLLIAYHQNVIDIGRRMLVRCIRRVDRYTCKYWRTTGFDVIRRQ